MALTGWGMTPLLSTFTDGHMQMQDAMKRKARPHPADAAMAMCWPSRFRARPAIA